VAAGRGEGGVEVRCDHRTCCREFAITAYHNGGAALERLAERKKGLAPHDDRLAQGERAEVLHVGPEPPRQRIAAADHAVLGDGGDEEDAGAFYLIFQQGHLSQSLQIVVEHIPWPAWIGIVLVRNLDMSPLSATVRSHIIEISRRYQSGRYFAEASRHSVSLQPSRAIAASRDQA